MKTNGKLDEYARYAKQGLAVGGTAWLVWSLMSSGALQSYMETHGFPIDKEMLRQWGPLFVLAMTALFMYDRNATRQINAMESYATAMRELAVSVNRVAEKDDAFQREQDALLNHVAIEIREMHTALKELASDWNARPARLPARPADGQAELLGRSPQREQKQHG